MFDEETEAKIDELADEIFEGVAEDRDVIFFEGGIVQSVPTGAPPEYITVEVEAIYDENVMWRGVPASLVVGDEVMVWENPKTHRREIAGGSGATTTSTSSPWQKITVAPSGGDFTLLSAAIVWINALAAPIAPAATRQFAINMLGGTFVEAAGVTVPQYVHVGGEGEGTVLDMGDDALTMSADTSLQEITVTSTADNAPFNVIEVAGNNVVLDDVRVICTNWNTCVDVTGYTGVELYYVTCETDTANCVGFYISNSTVEMWDCHANDSTNFWPALLIGHSGTPSTVTTRYCTFRGASADDDVDLKLNCTWNHFCCNFDPDNCSLVGTEVPLLHGKTNFDDVVTFENGFTMDGVSGGNVVTFPDNVANAMHFVDDTTGINFQQFISTAAVQATVFNVGEADVDFRVAVDAAASLTDPTHGFSVQGSTGVISMGVAPDPNAHLLIYNATVSTVNQFYGLWTWHQKTAGVTDETDTMHGLDSSMVIDQAGGVVGHTRGGRYHAWLEQGTVGAAVQAADLMGIEAEADGDGGTVYGSAIGVNALVNIDGTVLEDDDGQGHVYGIRSRVDLNTGTVDGDVYGLYTWVDDDIGAGGTVYMLYLAEQTGVDYGIYQNGTAQNLFGGIIRSGAGILLVGGVIDVNGIADAVVLDADGDTTISAPTDDQIDIEIAGTDYGELIERVLGWDEVVDVGTWYDYKLMDATEGDHFRQNLAAYPATWTEVDAPASSSTAYLYSFWWIVGSAGNPAWKYRMQTGINLGGIGAGTRAAFVYGPLLWRDGDWAADVHYYFGLYSDDGLGAIDEDIYIRVHLWWDSANSLWKIRGEEGDGSAGGEFTAPDHVGAWQTFYFPIHEPIWVRCHLRNDAGQGTRAYVGTTVVGTSYTLLLDQVPTVANWDATEDLWLEMHQTRGAGVQDYLYIGAVDYEETFF